MASAPVAGAPVADAPAAGAPARGTRTDGARSPAAPAADGRRQTILCLSQSYPPETTPTAIRAGQLLERLSARWQFALVTESERASSEEGISVEVVPSRRPRRLLEGLRRLRMSKLIELLVWPDDSIFWLLPAIAAARRVARETAPSAIVVFMMPYSAGLAGIVLKLLTGLPLVLNLDDSPTCTDMHPHHPSRLHDRLARVLEDAFVRVADEVIYVSQANLETVRDRQPARLRGKLHLVRYGADRARLGAQPPAPSDGFEVVYVGAMTGWWSLIDQPAASDPASRAYEAWTRLGRYERTVLDQRTSSPAVIGRAILDAQAAEPGWAGRVRLTIFGNPYPEDVVQRALASAGVESVVRVFGPVAHDQVGRIIAGADLLFITLPDRPDGSRGGRISAKTYEYLATDRPILAAVPPGENWDYLAGRPGVWLVRPGDHEQMRLVIAELAAAKFAGAPRSFDRRSLQAELSYDTRAQEFAAVLQSALAR